jgi:Fur family transcriptional regulator, ferric uptake regulator
MTEERLFERADQQFREYLRNVGMRGTSNKKGLVLRVFLRTTKPVTVMELAYLVKKEDIGLSYHTVYQTMNRLVACGLAIKIESPTEALRYRHELTFEKCLHPHLVCKDCGALVEIEKGESESEIVAG